MSWGFAAMSRTRAYIVSTGEHVMHPGVPAPIVPTG
jgi:hypothetical protein